MIQLLLPIHTVKILDLKNVFVCKALDTIQIAKINQKYDNADHNPNLTDNNSEWAKKANHYKIVLLYKRKQFTCYYSMGCGLTGEPKIEDILDSLNSDYQNIQNEANFESWATSMGYNDDSIKANKIYKICVKESYKFFRFLGALLMSELRDCEQC